MAPHLHRPQPAQAATPTGLIRPDPPTWHHTDPLAPTPTDSIRATASPLPVPPPRIPASWLESANQTRPAVVDPAGPHRPPPRTDPQHNAPARHGKRRSTGGRPAPGRSTVASRGSARCNELRRGNTRPTCHRRRRGARLTTLRTVRIASPRRRGQRSRTMRPHHWPIAQPSASS